MALKRTHQKLMDEFHFEHWGLIEEVLKDDEYDDCRVIYAMTNPSQTEIVYVGDTEQGRDVRGRLKTHIKDREK